MTKEILELAPTIIWKHFYNLTRIPRPSGHEKQVIEHIRQFAEALSFENKIESSGNLIIRKKPSPTKEKAKRIILQAHADMVPQKNSDKIHDFLTDPIEAIIDGDWVRANQTTLGADNGIGIAAILAVFESKDIQHGPLEALFTISEETNMNGAFGLDENDLNGQILLNLDSEDEGELYIGCAGGVDLNVSWSYKTKDSQNGAGYKISLSGLKGGHSGIDINLGRANANKLMAEILDNLAAEVKYQLIDFSGGNLRNAIPRDAEATIIIDDSEEEKLKTFLIHVQDELQNQYNGIEGTIILEYKPFYSNLSGMDYNDQVKLLSLLMNCPNGVIAMSESIPGVVQTSNNLAIVKTQQGRVEVKTLLRSADDSEKMKVAEQIKNQFTDNGAAVELCNDYPGWLPNMNSDVLHKAKATYMKIFGNEPKVKVIHAGLECGIIGGKLPGLDMISFGPTIRHPHSPDEKVHIGSVNKFWIFLRSLLEAFD